MRFIWIFLEVKNLLPHVCMHIWVKQTNEWMSEWVNEWMSEWVNEWMSEWVNEWMSEWVNEWMSEWVNEWVNTTTTNTHRPALRLCCCCWAFTVNWNFCSNDSSSNKTLRAACWNAMFTSTNTKQFITDYSQQSAFWVRSCANLSC